MEQHRLLLHIADPVAQILVIVSANILAKDRHPPVLNIIKMRDQGHQAAFAATGAADNTHDATPRNGKGNVLQGRLAGVLVLQGHIVKGNSHVAVPCLIVLGMLQSRLQL